MSLTLQTLPTWVVGVIMLLTAYIWLITINRKIRMDSRAIAYTLVIWGLMYVLSGFSPNREYEPIIRVFMSRVVIIMICLSQALPLLVSYIRSRGRGG